MREILSSVRLTGHARQPVQPQANTPVIHQNGQRCPCRSVVQQQHALGIVAETDGVQREHDEAVVQISFAHELTLPPAFPPSLTPACGPICSASRTPHCTIPPRVQSVVISTKCFALLPCEMAAVSVGLRRALQGVMRGTGTNGKPLCLLTKNDERWGREEGRCKR